MTMVFQASALFSSWLGLFYLCFETRWNNEYFCSILFCCYSYSFYTGILN